MAMNGRQKAMTGLLMQNSENARRNIFDATPPPGDPFRGINPLEALRLIVAECEAGNIAIVDLSSETFRNPRTFATFDSDFKSIVPGDCTMTLNMEIAPSGRVRDYVGVPVGSGGAGGSGSMGGGGGGGGSVYVTVNGVGGGGSSVDFADTDGDEMAEYEEEENFAGLSSPSFAADRAQDKRESAKPATPTGASAAREVIFDDDEGSPV